MVLEAEDDAAGRGHVAGALQVGDGVPDAILFRDALRRDAGEDADDRRADRGVVIQPRVEVGEPLLELGAVRQREVVADGAARDVEAVQVTASLDLVQVVLRDGVGEEVGGELDGVGVDGGGPVDESEEIHRAFGARLGLQVLPHRVGGEPDPHPRATTPLHGLDGRGNGRERGGCQGRGRSGEEGASGGDMGTSVSLQSSVFGRDASLPTSYFLPPPSSGNPPIPFPAVRAQRGDEFGGEGRCVTRREVGFDVAQLAHARDGRRHGGMMQDEAQGEVGERRARGHERAAAPRRGRALPSGSAG